MGDPRLDAKLADFLSAFERDQNQGNTLANVRLDMHALRLDVQELTTQQQLTKMRVDRHGRDIAAIKNHLSWEGEEMDTGQHQIADLKKALHDQESARRDSGIWWKRQRWQWFAAALGAVAVLVLNTLVTVLLTKK
jgi:septal ring factor EnvC (AmiA/AmiB activator)